MNFKVSLKVPGGELQKQSCEISGKILSLSGKFSINWGE